MDTNAEAIETAAKEIAELFGATADLLSELFQQIADLAYEILPSHLCSDNNTKPKAEPRKKNEWSQQHDQRYKILFVFGRRKRKKRRPDSDGAASSSLYADIAQVTTKRIEILRFFKILVGNDKIGH